MQYVIRHNFTPYSSLGINSAILYKGLDLNDRLSITFYKWDETSGTLSLLVPANSNINNIDDIDGVEVLVSNSIFAKPFYEEPDVTTSSSHPAIINSRPVHDFSLVHFNLSSILEVFNYARETIPQGEEIAIRDEAILMRESYRGASRTPIKDDNKTLFFTDTITRFPSLKATADYSPLDYFKTLEVNHQGTNVTDTSHRENLASNLGVPCPPRWDYGIGFLHAVCSNNPLLINFYKNKISKLELIRK